MEAPMRTITAYARTLVLTGGLLAAGLGLLPLTGHFVGPAEIQAAEQKERHPHIHAAIRELREAKRELERADHDFGGHRKEAIKAIDHAIIQLEKALKYDKR
jgi:hypothetical protein